VPAKNRSYLKKQELKQSQEERNFKSANAEAERLKNHLDVCQGGQRRKGCPSMLTSQRVVMFLDYQDSATTRSLYL
jgi:hypothetical protein